MDMVATTTAPQDSEEAGARRIPVLFTEVELYVLSEFLNGEGDMADVHYEPISRKLLIAAAKAGLYDEVL